MASRFWTGAVNSGTGTWDASNTANWSTTTGGAGGASVPTSADAVFFDANSGSGTCTLGANVVFQTINMTGYTGTINFSTFKMSTSQNAATIINTGNTATLTGLKLIEATYAGATGTRTIIGSLNESNAPDISVTAGSDFVTGGIQCRDYIFTGFSGTLTGNFQIVFGNLTLSATMSTNPLSTGVMDFSSTNASPKTITSNGVEFKFNIRFSGAGGSWQFADNLSVASNKWITLKNGTFLTGSKTISAGAFFTEGGTKTLDFGSGTWNITGDNATFASSVWAPASAGFTTIPGTGTITMTSANAKTFSGVSNSYPTLNQGGAGTLTISGSNTFTNITNTVQPATITFTSGTTQTVSSFTVSGTAGNLITLNASTPGSAAKLSDASGINSVSFCSIKDITATGFATWKAYTSNGNVNAGNNVGWFFSVNPSKYIYSVRKAKRIIP